MTSTSASDVSLYELALTTDLAPPVLQVSPATLKSMLSAFIDLIVERALPAIVWAKLPKGDTWQAELERYSTLEGIPRGLYVFKNHREEGIDDAGMVGAAIADSTPAPSQPTANITNVWHEIQLSPDSQLRREYFLIVWTADFQGAILAHRPRSAHLSKATGSSVPDTKAGLTELGLTGAIDDPHERRQHLLLLASFDATLIQHVLKGLEGAQTIAASGSEMVAANEPSNGALPVMALTDAVMQWHSLMPTEAMAAIDPTTLGHLFVKQLQRQEEIWQRHAVYRRQAELVEPLQLHNEELTSALRSKEDFINTVGQELRTPLTTIKTALTLLNSPSLKLPQRQRYMDLIAKECDRQSNLITSLLDLVQFDQIADQTVLQPLRVYDVVPGVVSTYQPLAEEKGIVLTCTVPDDLPAIACMSSWLKQIVINLLHNGIKFTPSGGQVWVRARQKGNYVNLEFSDTGVGMAPHEIPKIFDRFYRVRQSAALETGGAGLGLTIVQQLIIHAGGSISVKSKPGEGSTFSVLLPIHRVLPLPTHSAG